MSGQQKNGERSNSDEGEGDSDLGVLAPKVQTTPRVNRLNNSAFIRGDVGDITHDLTGIDDLREHLWMEQYGGERNLFSALGYVRSPEYPHYRARYERTDTAKALIDKLPKKAWAQPKIIDTGAEEEETEFERVAEEFLAGEYTSENPIEVLERAARMERLGKYSLIFIGFNDDAASPDRELPEGREPEDSENTAEQLLSNEVDTSSLEEMDPEEAIVYIEPYDEGRVEEDSINWETGDPTSEKFGEPIEYRVDMGDNRPVANIHWSRVIHVVGNIFDDRFESSSILKQSLNRIDDIEKILGGSAEAYWRSAYQGLVISPPEVNGEYAEFTDSGDDLHKQINRYINNFSREIFTEANVEPIEVNAKSPMDFVEAQYRDLATGHDIPQSILMGNETGERATEEDREMWHERVGEFRVEYCEPAELRPLFDRLIRMNAFPEPEGGPSGYRIVWPPLDEKSEKELWEIRQTIANTIQTGTGGKPQQVISPEEFREKVLGWSPERGSETQGSPPALAETSTEELEVDEEDVRVQQQFEQMVEMAKEMRANQSFEEEDKVETPEGHRGFVVDIIEDSFSTDEVSVDASEEEPKIIVVTESDETPFGFYDEDELEKRDWSSGVDDPASELKESEGDDRENVLTTRIEEALAQITGKTQQEGHFTWPESWRESEKPARLIAMDAWLSMGPSGVSSCIREMRGEIAGDPARFCADFADRLYQWEYWRGDSWAPGE